MSGGVHNMTENYIKLRCKPEEKAAISRAATQEGRSISNYLLMLARRDMKVKAGIYLKDRIERVINEEIMKNGNVEADPVSVKLILTLDEKVTFIERIADELEDNYWWEFDGNELTISRNVEMDLDMSEESL